MGQRSHCRVGEEFEFLTTPPQVGLYLLIASGLRLGVLPLHLPYSAESTLRRGFGTTLRLVSAASSLALLAHIPASSLASPLTPLLLILAAIAGIYGGWMWLRAPDELIGRPFWMIGLASLAIAAALLGNPTGTVAWGTALILIGGALFLASVQQVWISRALLVGAFSLSALPFSLTASGWQGNVSGFWYIMPFLLIAQALLMTGFIRSALRPSTRASLESLPIWARGIYPVGIGLLFFAQILIGNLGLERSLANWHMGSRFCRFSSDLWFAMGYSAFPGAESCTCPLGTAFFRIKARPLISKPMDHLSLA